MNIGILTLVLALLWTAITGDLSLLNLLVGATIGGLALYLMRDRLTGPLFLTKLRRIGALVLLFTYELLLSALKVAFLVVSPNLKTRLRPGIIAFPLTVTRDAEITLLANLITLTPGTLSVDVSEDRRFLYVHCITISDKDALIRDIAKGFETKVAEVFK